MDFNIIAELSADVYIQWSTVQVATKDGCLFIRYGWGCSCNYIEDEEFEPLTSWHELIETVNSLKCQSDFNPAEKTEFLAVVAAAMKKENRE